MVKLYSALLIDDDYTTVQSLSQRIPWEEIQFRSPYMAYSAAEARKIIQKHTIHLILCDIEMPREDGLSLLEWIRARNLPIECIFLTNHLEFTYAQKAIGLGCLEYVSKNATTDELLSVLTTASIKIRKNELINQRDQNKFSQSLAQQLISDLVLGKLPSEEVFLRNIVNARPFPFASSQSFFIFLFSFGNETEYFSEMTYYEKNFIVLNILENSFEEYEPPYFVSYKTADYYYVASLFRNDEKHSLIQLRETIEKIYNPFKKMYVENPTVYMEEHALHLWEIPSWYENAQREDINNTFLRQQIISISNLKKNTISPTTPLLLPETLEKQLRNNQSRELLRDFRHYISELTHQVSLLPQDLRALQLQFIQLITTQLKEKDIPVHFVFNDAEQTLLDSKATRSVMDFAKWVSYIIPLYGKVATESSLRQTPVQQMCHYIHNHYHLKLSRDTIAKSVHLTPDYAGRIFKAETGMSINDYLIDYRIEKAKEFLADTSQSISEVSEHTGFMQFAHFSSTFRSITGMSPREYRQLLINGNTIDPKNKIQQKKLTERKNNTLNSSSLNDVQLIDQIVTFIHDNLEKENLNRQLIAQSIPISESYLSHLFQKEMGVALSSYISSQRLLKAKSLLENPTLSISLIAMQSGFGSASYFIQAFRKNYGLTPTEYRKQTKNNL